MGALGNHQSNNMSVRNHVLFPLNLFICKEAVTVPNCKVSREFVSVKQNMTHAAICPCLTSIANMFSSGSRKNNVPLATAGKKKYQGYFVACQVREVQAQGTLIFLLLFLIYLFSSWKSA